MSEIRRSSLVKPTLNTRYHIDYEWWQNNDRDWHVYLKGLLCSEHQSLFGDQESSVMVDWIDPETAEVQRVDGIQHALFSHCALLPEFRSQHMPMVDTVFRIFLTNGNSPLTPEELATETGKDARMILKTFSGLRTYKGIRPVIE